jgi:hypothetical protein
MVMVFAFSPQVPQRLEAMPQRPRDAKPFAQHAAFFRQRAAIWPNAAALLVGETRRPCGGVLMNLSAFLTKTVI